jgi:hypothetical protein
MARCRVEGYRVASASPEAVERENERRGIRLQWAQTCVVVQVVCDDASAHSEGAGPVEESQERGRGRW